MKIDWFIELGAPVTGAYGLGFYAAGSRDPDDPNNNVFYYLHDDGNVYDFCRDIAASPSDGWFNTKEDCVAAATAYYKKYGLVYPYNRTNDVAQSEPMDFE